MCKRETLDIREPKMKNCILRRRQVCETTSCCDPTQSRKRKRGTKKILTFDQMSLVFFRVSHSHFRMNKKFLFSFFFFSPKNVFFRCAKGCSLTDTLPGKKKALPSRPVFPPIWQLHASTIIFDSSLRLYLFTSQHTQTSYAQHRLDRVVAELGYSKGPPSSIYDRFIIQSRHWFDLTIQSKVVQ